MNFKDKETYLTAKEQLIRDAKTIKETRAELKKAQRAGESVWKLQDLLNNMIYTYRHFHIAYSIAKGHDYHDIERKTKPGNEPSWGVIDQLLYNLGGEA